MVNLRAAQVQRSLQVAKVVVLQERRMREASDLASPICERVANVRRSKAVADTCVLGVGLAVHLLDFLGPFWNFLLSESCVLILPGFEVEAFLWLSVVVAVQEHWIVLEVVQSQGQVSGMYTEVSNA